MRPTVITNISDSSPAMTEEIFGTIHCIITVMVISIQCRSCCKYCTIWFWGGGKNFVIRKLSNGSYCCFHRLFRGLILYHMDWLLVCGLNHQDARTVFHSSWRLAPFGWTAGWLGTSICHLVVPSNLELVERVSKTHWNFILKLKQSASNIRLLWS